MRIARKMLNVFTNHASYMYYDIGIREKLYLTLERSDRWPEYFNPHRYLSDKWLKHLYSKYLCDNNKKCDLILQNSKVKYQI